MTTSPKPRKLGRILLVGSLALNVLLAGLIVGSLATGRSGPPRGFEPQLGPLGQVLSKEDRAQIAREIRRELRGLERSGKERGAAMATVVSLLEAETFDAEAFANTIRDQQMFQDQVRDVALTRFVAHVNDMSTDERRAVAETLRDRLSRNGEGRKNNGGN